MRKSWLFPGDNDEPYVSQRAGAYQPQSEKRRRWTKRLVILGLILCVLYPFVEPYTLRTTQTAITCEDLPASIGQLRIVYVSDIHYGSQMFSDARLSSLINRINALNADIVLLGGDYARDKWSAAAFFENLPRRISSNYGVYAVVGECDRSPLEKGEEPSTLRNKMSKAGVTLLCNEVTALRIGTSDIYIAGIDDVSTEMDDAKSVAAQVNSKDFVIFLAHNPSVISSSLLLTDRNGRGNWFDLGLFGHTHGGQIPFFGRSVQLQRCTVALRERSFAGEPFVAADFARCRHNGTSGAVILPAGNSLDYRAVGNVKDFASARDFVP